jgi:hypothetical protein
LEESGNAAFSYLRNLTEPEVVVRSKPWRMPSIGCSAPSNKYVTAAPAVTVVEEKLVAGFHAVVLKAESADALVNWLNERKYSFSPEVKAWVAPYVEQGWNITALQVAKNTDATGKSDGISDAGATDAQPAAKSDTVSATALRMSFKTDRPLFPYREPDSKSDAEKLGAQHRLLRIYFLSDSRYAGSLGQEHPWSGRAAWAGKLSQADRSRVLELLKLPEATGPAQWWLTEFEDDWAYQPAPADVTFALDSSQQELRREPIIHYTYDGWQLPRDVTLYAVFAVVAIPPLLLRWRRGGRRHAHD